MRKGSSKKVGSTMVAVVPVLAAVLSSGAIATMPASALETAPAAETLPTTEFTLDPDNKDHDKERKEIETILSSIEEQWNSHNLDKVMSYYADDYVNNDGLDKHAVAKLTEDFWKTYPDAKSFSKVKQVRIEGNFATVESRDMATGSTAKEMPVIGTKGDLRSISEGQLYMKRIGSQWRIIGDRIDYEKVRVAFGMARQLAATFSAPEQVKSGRSYSARLELALPANLTAVGSITSQPLEYPQPQPADAWRPVEGPVLERILPANTNNRNELLMATIGITDAARSALKGIEFLTRRLNVVPQSEDKLDATTAEAKSDKATDAAAGHAENSLENRVKGKLLDKEEVDTKPKDGDKPSGTEEKPSTPDQPSN